MKKYGGNGYKLTALVSYRQTGVDDDRKHTAKGEAGNDGKLADNLSRAKSRILELALCNPWELFVTLTLDPRKYDRSDLPKFIKDLGQMIRDFRKKSGQDVKYLLIPERHLDGSWHMHGFLMGISLDKLRPFQSTEHIPYRILERLSHGVQVYTWEQYEKRFGYATMEEIQNRSKASSYITKYITKEAMHTITELNAHAFYASKGLKEARTIAKDVMVRGICSPDYENEYCSIKWYEEEENALSHFKE